MKSLLQALFLSFITVQIVLPQWSSDPTINLAVCTADETQRETRICKDDNGNVFLFWRDYRNETTLFGGDIYAQKLDINGNPVWIANGTSIITGFGGQFDPKVVSDGEQGTYLVWRTSPNSFQNYSLHAQRLNNDGNSLWGSSGITVQSNLGTTISPVTNVNESDDLLITWQLALTGVPNSVDIYAQKINAAGIIQWGTNGLLICPTSGGSVLGPRIISDNKGGAIISWSDNRSGSNDFNIYAQRVNSNGNVLWTANGIPVCAKTGNQNTKHIIPDNSGGAIIFWEDILETSYNICAQRIDSLGNKFWEPEGKVLYSTTNPFTQFEFVLDRNKEIYFLWSNSENNIYAQKIDYDGNLVWSNEISICTTQSSISYLSAFQSDVNGIIISWLDNRSGNNDIYGQWISSDGSNMWNYNGDAICKDSHEQSDYCVTSDNFGGAIIAWGDLRNGNYDIYTQNIDIRGELGSNRYLFQKSGVNKIISSSNPTSDTINVSLPSLRDFGYYSITVMLDSIIHPAVNELMITLTHLGISDTIVYNLSGGQNILGTYLDDFALSSLSSSSAPFSGIFKPFNPLSIFINSDLNGVWILQIEDNLSANNGTLESWGLFFNKGEMTGIEFYNCENYPDNFILHQNFPNPFNPSTKISWQAPVGSWQTLKVYDLLGKEVATLVDEYKPAGSYEVEFDGHSDEGQNLSSGVYFYQLSIRGPETSSGQGIIQTKKMILIK